MNLTADEIKCTLTFTLDNNVSFSLNTSDVINKTNFLTSVKLSEELSSKTNIPVGVINSSVLDLVIISKNRALVPNNPSSVYYGHLNTKAKIQINIEANNHNIFMGTYYVDEWKSNASNTTADQVVISATGLMHKISKLDMPMTDLNNIENFKDYLLEVFEVLNTKLQQNGLATVVLNSANINFSEFPNMQYANLKMDDIGTMLNDISQATLTNIYIDRNDTLKTDFCCDDQYAQIVADLDVMTAAQIGDDFSLNYDGISTKYSKYNIGDIESIASITNEQLVVGDNTFNDIDLGQNIYKVNRIVTSTDDVDVIAYTKSALFNKKKLNLVINSDGSSVANINILGRKVDSTKLTYAVGGENKLEVDNIVLDYNYIEKYTNMLNQLLQIKNNSMTVTCYITPDVINLGDIVHINCAQAMSVSGDYKIVGIRWEFSTYAKATLKLIKTFELEYDIDAILSSQNRLFELSLGGYTITETLDDISERENEYIEEHLSTPLYNLRVILGEV